jgi:hypothetical protein
MMQDHEPMKGRGPQKLEKAKKWSPRALRRNAAMLTYRTVTE